MGTTMSFYYIKNQDFSRGRLQEILGQSFPKKGKADESFFDSLKLLLGDEKAEILKAQMEQDDPSLFEEGLPSPMVAYRPDAPWLPFFEERLCEGYNASSRDAHRLSRKFKAPVLAFSLFDSDLLLVSYCDAAQKIRYDYAKPNFEEMEEYDTELYKAEFPQFLAELCPGVSEDALKEIWDAEEDFADDRMEKLCTALRMVSINRSVPDGFEAITALES